MKLRENLNDLTQAGLISLPSAIMLSVALACTPQQGKTAADIVLKLADVTCVILNSELDAQAIQKVCAVEHLAVPVIQQLISASATASAKRAATEASVPKPAMSAPASPMPPPATQTVDAGSKPKKK